MVDPGEQRGKRELATETGRFGPVRAGQYLAYNKLNHKLGFRSNLLKQIIRILPFS